MTTYERIITEELELLRADIIKASIAAGQKATGDTYKSLKIDNVTSFTGQLYGYEFIGVLATGRKAGKIPYDFASIIMEWGKAKGLNIGTDKEFRRWANAVAWKIRRDGTKLYQKERGGSDPNIFEIPIQKFSDRIVNRIAIATQKSISVEIGSLFDAYAKVSK